MEAPLNPNDPNVAQLEVVATHLGEALRQQLVFVGGAIAGLLITDVAQPAIRPTEDVDLVAHVLARADYYQLEQALRVRGFAQDMRPGAPICRWTIERVTVDVMPTLDEVLGFSNRWYALAVETAQNVTLPSGAQILVVTAAAFVATKLEAFDGRGGGDYLSSHDLGDVISVIDGRDGLWDEVQQTRDELKAYLAEQFRQLMATRAFRDSLPGHLPGDAASQARLPDLEAKLEQLAQMRNP
jgi:predicted nucleotidyltransferase